MMFTSIDTERLNRIMQNKTPQRADLFKEQCRECTGFGKCSSHVGKAGGGCFTCSLCRQSAPGSYKGLCVCLNVPTVKEKEAGKCKYFNLKEQTDERETV